MRSVPLEVSSMNPHRVALMAAVLTAGAFSAMAPAVVGAAGLPDACALLSQAEIGAMLGVVVDPGERLMPNEPRFCTWREHGKDPLKARNVRLSLLSDREYNIGKTPLPTVTRTPESGLGDEAYFSKAKGAVFNLSVKKGATCFRVQARSNPAALVKSNTDAIDQKDREIDLAVARAVIKKL
jgi:hypothetical protein